MSSFQDEENCPSMVKQADLSSGQESSQPVENVNDPDTTSIRMNTIKEDHTFIKEYLTPAAIITLSKEFVTLVIIRTQYARVLLRLRFTENYPNELPTLELSSPTLPLPLLQNKEKECLENARQFLGQSMMRAIYEPIYKFIHTNMFVPCWKEMKQIATICDGKGKVGADEKDGTVQLRLKCGAYKQGIKLTVPYNYPEEGVKIEFLYSNFPTDIQYMFQSQADDIVRRCVSGATIEQALQVSNPIKLIDTSIKPTSTTPRLTTDNLKNLKHDVNVLKQISDLRIATNSSGGHRYYKEVNAERREARRDLRKLAREETVADQEEEKAILEQEQFEMKELLKGKASEVAQPSLYAVVRFLVDDYACRLPLELCQSCKKPVLSPEPESEILPTIINNTSKAKNARLNMRPMRTFCGHWLHHNCLNEWLTTPPFIHNCPVCSRRIWHPDWPEDHKQLEKAWQANEARKREMNDVSKVNYMISFYLFIVMI